MGNIINQWKEPSFTDLLCHVAAEGSGLDCALFAVTAWWIWRDRNNVVHGSKELHPAELIQRAVDWLAECSHVLGSRSNEGDGQTVSETETIHWVPPLATWLKLNFDGACDFKQGRVGLGAVIRDEVGALRGAMAIPCVIPLSPLATEALALLNGLKYCRELGVSKIEIEGDALTVLQALDATGVDLSEIGVVIEEVKLVMLDFEMVSWKHVKKKGNIVAHRLDRSALQIKESMFCQEVGPSWIHDLVEEVIM